MTRVFVSSTIHDLVDVRAELEVHLRDLGLDPVLSESVTSEFSAAAEGDSIRKCLVQLEQCDVVLFIFSQHYGPELPAPWGPRSATHVEYDHAVEKGRRLFVYVRDRTLGEFDAWRDHKRVPLDHPRWVKKTEQQSLFSLIEHHQSKIKSGQGEDNWRWTFADSLELKRLVAKDLQRESLGARIRALTASGKMPVLGVAVSLVNPMSKDLFEVTVHNHLPSEPAIDVTLEVQQDDRQQNNDPEKNHHLFVLGTLGALSLNAASNRLQSSHRSEGVHVFSLKLRYSTTTGAKILETWGFHRGTAPGYRIHLRRANKEIEGMEPWA